MKTPRDRLPLYRYGLALASTCAAAALRQSLSVVVGATAASIPFAPAVMVSAWYGGLGPGLLATLLGALAANYLWLHPPYTLAIPNLGESVSLALFVFTGVVISGLNEALHRHQLRTSEMSRELVRTEQRYHQLLDGISDYAIARLDAHGLVLQWMPGARRVTGFSGMDVMGRSFRNFFGDEAANLGLDRALDQARETGRCEWEGWHQHREGAPFWANTVLTPLQDPEMPEMGFALITRDVTARKKAEEALLASQSALRELSAHLQSVREEERTRIAREIHDELGQSLSYLKMGLSWLRDEVPAHATETVEQLTRTLNDSVRSVRRIAEDLRPSVLDEFGICAAIEWHVKSFASQTGIRCSLPEELPRLELDADRSTALYRILQEALTNVLRHAGAARIRVDIAAADDVVTLIIDDDGRGIPPDTRDQPPGFGILGMRERALAVGGRLEIAASPQGGTRVRVRIPYTSPAVPGCDTESSE